MRVFVLGTGRCGTTTFARACSALTNYTSGHETRAREIGSDRFRYPDQHIEADNRLGWMLGTLGQRFDDATTFYVHLRRNEHDVVASFLDRWESEFRASIMRAFSHGIVMRSQDWPTEQRLDVCRFYVQTMTDNITQFMRGRNSMEMWIESASESFDELVDRIGGEGDLAEAKVQLSIRHNAR